MEEILKDSTSPTKYLWHKYVCSVKNAAATYRAMLDAAVQEYEDGLKELQGCGSIYDVIDKEGNHVE